MYEAKLVKNKMVAKFEKQVPNFSFMLDMAFHAHKNYEPQTGG